MLHIHRRDTRKRGRQAICFLLITAMVLGLVPKSATASAAPKAAENTYESEGCTITYKESSAWGNYVVADITIKNEGTISQANWKLSLIFNATIDNIWNADILSSEVGTCTIGAKMYNSVIEPGQTVSFGFMAYGTGGKPQAPAEIKLVNDKPSEDDKEGKDEEDDGDGSGGGGLQGPSYAIPDKWKALNYALFTSGEQTLSFYTGQTDITGSVHSNRDFYYQGTTLSVDGVLETAGKIDLKTSSGGECCKVSSQKEQAGQLAMPDITKEVSGYVRENGKVYENSMDFQSNSIVVDKPVLIQGNAAFHATHFLGTGIIYARDSITYNVGDLATPDNSRVLLAAENGNITLNGSDITLNAVLYAPNGCVTINANRVNLHGRIIAKQICINGTMIQINAGAYDLDMLDFLFKPEIAIAVEGNQKENRKITLDIEEILNTEYLVKEDTKWNIVAKGEELNSGGYVIDEKNSDNLHKELLFTRAGTYEVSVTVTTGKVEHTVTKEIVIEKDLEPVAGFALPAGCFARDEAGKAAISLADASYSPDDDEIGQRIWTVYYDKNNDGKFTEDEAAVFHDGNETDLVYTANRVGKYKVELCVVETFSDTIPELLPENAYKSDNTAELEEAACVFEVGNEAPQARVDVQKAKSADIVFTIGDTDKDTLKTYNEKAEELKKTLKEKGVDARIDAVSASTLTAQDTFAWKEYDHYNYKDRWLPTLEKHILYEGDDIRMLGYSWASIRDFLYVADDNPGQKTFEFDSKRDRTDWHSMEGGGFLFNTTVDEDKDTIRGFCILVSQQGLKLVQIDCDSLKKFRNGGYSLVYHAGKLLRTYSIGNVYDNHHFKIVVDAKSISVWDGEKLVIDDYVLPENDYGYGFGPIIGHASHSCEQQSYFTFKNITMQTMTGKNLSSIIDGYDWRPGSSHYVINLSKTEVPELSSDEETAALAAALIENQAAFIGIGNDSNEDQYRGLLAVTETGGMYKPADEIGTSMDEVNAWLADTILAKDYRIEKYITTDDIITYEGYYQDAENDAVYEQRWEYEYDPSVFGEKGEAEHIVRKESEPLTVFEDTGAYRIRLNIRDNPAGDNDALDSYRKWSGTEEYEKLLIVQSRPQADVSVVVSKASGNDTTKCIANTTYSADDADHPGDAKKGIREEYFYYKNVKDGRWTEGKLPNALTVGETYLVKYQVKDIEGTLSFPAVAVVKTSDLRSFEEPEDNLPPEVYIDAEKTEIRVGEEIRIDGYAIDDFGVDAFTMSIDGEKVLDSFGRVMYTPEREGIVTVEAEATDIGGNTAKKKLEITVIDDRDRTAPTAVITSPLAGSELGFDVPIIGTAADETKLAGYTLSYRAGKEEEYHVFKESSDAVKEDILGTLNIKDFEDGTYEILLTAKDAAGNVSHCGLLLYIETGVTREYVLQASIKSIQQNEETGALDIYGTACADGHLKKYTLSYQCNGGGDMVSVAAGTEEVADGILGSIPVEELISGTYNLLLTVEDVNGNAGTACGAFTYTAGSTGGGEGGHIDADLVAPDAMITGVCLSDDNAAVEIKGTAKDDRELAGWQLEYAENGKENWKELASGTEAVEDTLLSSLPTEELGDGTYRLRLTAWDTYGNSRACTMEFSYKKGGGDEDGRVQIGGTQSSERPTAQQLAVNLSHHTADLGTKVEVQVTVPDAVKEESLKIFMGEKQLAAGTKKTSFTSDQPGCVVITAEGVTEDGKTVSAEASCAFYNSQDQNPPTLAITSPASDSVLTEPTDLVGSAFDDEELDFWRLEYRLAEEKEYTLLAEGRKPVKNDVLGHLDTTMLMNGKYNVRLIVQDTGGNRRTLERSYVVEGELKVGAMHIGFTDITASISGMTVNLNRMYDSRDKAKGEFGYGWTLGMQGVELYENESIVQGYELVQSGTMFATGYQMTERLNHDVTVSYGDGTSDRFQLTFTPERRALVPISEVELGYRCVTNPKVKLEILGDTTAYVGGSQLLFYDKAMYGDLSYKLTTEEGTKIYLSKKKGVYKLEDSNGNTVTVDENGYHSADGRSIVLERDEQGRVVAATDPAGSTTTYAYDRAGDLISVTDAADRTVSFTYDKMHNLISITDPMGIAAARNEYDDDGRLIAVIDADGNRMEYAHDVEGRTEIVTDRLGNKTVYLYDERGNILSTTDANGKTTKSTYDSYGNVLTKTDAAGNVTTYAYDPSGNLSAVTDAEGNTLKNTYNSRNQITSMNALGDTEILIDYDRNGDLTATTDAEGNQTQYAYDAEGNVTGVTDQIGKVMSAKYDKDGNVIESTDSAGNRVTSTYDEHGRRLTQTTYAVTENGTQERTTHYVYNAAGELIQTVDPDGNSTSVERNRNGKMSAAIDSRGRRTEYKYDQRGNVTNILYPDGTTEQFEYDAENRNTKTVSRTGLTTTYTYDKTGNLLKQADARGNTVSYTYDSSYNLLTTTNAAGAATTYTYDKLNRNTSVTDEEGNVTRFTYNALSLQTSVTDPKGNTTRYEYDGNGNRIKIIYPDGTETQCGYDARGRVIWKKDAEGRKTEYTYDSSDQLVSVKQPGGAATTYAYDKDGNLTAAEDPNGNVTRYEYDEAGRRTRVILPDGTCSTSSYDQYGKLVSTEDCNHVKTSYEYDEHDRVIREQAGNETTSYQYDAYGRLAAAKTGSSEITYTYNQYGELQQKTYENGEAVRYIRDRYGRTAEILVLHKGKELASTKYGYDKMSRLTRVVGRNGEATVYTYDENGNRETATFASGVKLTYTYDNCNRLTMQKAVDRNGAVIAQYTYTIGKNGERTKTKETGASGETETEYAYDAANRLVKETIRTGSQKTVYEYGYDQAGNRTSREKDGIKTTYTYDSRNRLTTEKTGDSEVAYYYDANGSLLKQSGWTDTIYTYDSRSRLTAYQ